MSSDEHTQLIDQIDGLIEAYLAARSSRSRERLSSSELRAKVLEHGAFATDDPASEPALALLAIGEQLGGEGGIDLMRDVHRAYAAEFGSKKASVLEARWDGAAGIWYR